MIVFKEDDEIVGQLIFERRQNLTAFVMCISTIGGNRLEIFYNQIIKLFKDLGYKRLQAQSSLPEDVFIRLTGMQKVCVKYTKDI